jgi:hypothetical protein
MVRENICHLFVKQRTDNQNIQGAQKTKLPPKINDPMKKWTNELNRAFSKEDVQIAKNTCKNAHHPWPSRKCKKKTTLRFYLTPVRIATIKNTINNKCW